MNKPSPLTPRPANTGADDSLADWREAYAAALPDAPLVRNRSGIEIEPLYGPGAAAGEQERAAYAARLGVPGEYPYTRGIYTSMHRGRAWTQRQLIGLGTPADYNARLHEILHQGATALSLIPCNSVFRGYDMDTVPFELLGTCGTVVNTWAHMDDALGGVPLAEISVALNDPSPFTLLAFLVVVAERRGIDLERLGGTANQSDYLSHYIANHMFYRLDLDGARRLLVDKIEWCNRHLPRYNPLSVVGQHMQQAGATPAEAMAFALCSAIQYAEDCIARGLEPDSFLPRFTFFFDISLSFFEEIAKLRAGRRLWARIARERLGARDPRSWRFKFHAQTSGVDLTRQQPLNNIARVTAQAIAGIFGGLQSLHTDGYDEALSCPTTEAARVAIATQNILREEAGLTDVIDPLGGSYYVETLTDDMEARIVEVMDQVAAAGGMLEAARSGLVQRMIGASARRFQARVESGEQTVVGVNAYQCEERELPVRALHKPDAEAMRAHRDAFGAWKAARAPVPLRGTLDALARAAASPPGTGTNLFAAVVEAARAGATHQEICDTLRETLGFGHVQAVV